MITGLLGNALGYNHGNFDQLQTLQQRLQYAIRQDRAGKKIQDYQTVDLSQGFMRDDNAWTTRGWLDKRKGGSASKGTHIRLRDYYADALYTIALTLRPTDESPTISDLKNALQYPERPLFIGRKACLPSSPLFIDQIQAENLTKALQTVELADRADNRATYPAWWPVDESKDHPRADIEKPITDKRDWANQIHTGERWIAKGEIEINTDKSNHE